MKKLLIGILSLTLGLLALFFTSSAHAQDQASAGSPWFVMAGVGTSVSLDRPVDMRVSLNRSVYDNGDGLEVAMSAGPSVFAPDGVANSVGYSAGVMVAVERTIGVVFGYDPKLAAGVLLVQTNPTALSQTRMQTEPIVPLSGNEQRVYAQINRR